MKKIKIINYLVLLSFAILFSACKSKNKIDLKEFKLNKYVLSNHEQVTVLASSENPENGDEDYLIHMIVKSIKSGDTINVLFIGPREIYGEEIKSFISPDDPFFNAENTTKIDINSMNEVYSNPEFITLSWRKYPSVIGKIMTIYDMEGKTSEDMVEKALDMIKNN